MQNPENYGIYWPKFVEKKHFKKDTQAIFPGITHVWVQLFKGIFSKLGPKPLAQLAVAPLWKSGKSAEKSIFVHQGFFLECEETWIAGFLSVGYHTDGSGPTFRKVRHSESRHSWSLQGIVLDIATTRRLSRTDTNPNRIPNRKLSLTAGNG